MVKGQKPWINGIEHGRYWFSVGNDVRNFCLASDEAQVKAWLEHELGCSLRTWQSIFREKGYPPTGMNAGFIWDDLSDTGGYAHLISAGAEWVLYLDGKRDWEVQNIPAVN